jgi:argininosuccinate synthase
MRSWSTTVSGISPLREALAAFVDKTQENVSGDREAQALQGQHHQGRALKAVPTASIRKPSPPSARATTTRRTRKGFINLYGLPDTVQALREQGKL